MVGVERRAIEVDGIVQGVGFRPFVYGLASRLHLQGFVRNRTGSVLIEVEGDCGSLERFLEELSRRPPPLAHIDRLSWVPLAPRGDSRFSIESSEVDHQGAVLVSPDVATCPQCVAELFDPCDRRYRYPFLNCANCGPRLTIITGSPYDRPQTTMAGFPMCGDCRHEYEDPADRRFHAQPTACPACGPRVQLLDAAGKSVEADDPLERFVHALRRGQIGAMKGMGGYHLICDAHNEAAVAELRRRKHRDDKPFALMVQDLEAARTICEISPLEGQLLQSPRAPIVLLPRKVGCPIAAAVAPGNPLLGLMLPYTPLHHLLMRDVAPAALVMTSGNRSDEPIAHQEDDAVERLGGIADLLLVHNRPIHVRCDDSVTRVIAGEESPLRRSRGYAPQPVRLPLECPRPILAVGGQLKVVFALGRGQQAILSHHMGDLDHFAAFRAFQHDIDLYEELFAIRPQCIAHDLHPDYASTRYAIQRAGQTNAALLPIQHHHAHLASCMAEHGLSGPVIGVTFDGTGYGTDGAVWGGEFLVGDYRRYQRAAHLRYVGLPGGEQAIREPWRMAVTYLLDAGCSLDPVKAAAVPIAMRNLQTMLERHLNTPPTSSAGRLFDAVAALLGLRHRVTYEGQAAMELEWLATGEPLGGVYPFELSRESPEKTPENRLEKTPEWALIVDPRPMIRAISADLRHGVEARRIARRFHATVVEMIGTVCGQIRQAAGLDRVVLSGGVFMNALLTLRLSMRLRDDGFHVFRHRVVPPNDGGLSLGQLAIAAASDPSAEQQSAEQEDRQTTRSPCDSASDFAGQPPAMISVPINSRADPQP